MLSITEENYLKAILYLSFDSNDNGVGTNELATSLSLSPASVSDMLKKIRSKNYIEYEKYGKIYLTVHGRLFATQILRKHRLWETFLYEKLDFTWDEVHEVAEQLEHIKSDKLIEKLDDFLGHPKFDPHGDPIPNKNGEFEFLPKKMLSDIEIGESCKIVAVKDNSVAFLNYVVEIGLGINNQIKVISKQAFDLSLEIEINEKRIRVSQKFAQHIYVI